MMSAATRKRYALWLAFCRSARAAARPTGRALARTSEPQPAWAGYGASPHVQRLEGYPIDQAIHQVTTMDQLQSEARSLLGGHSREGSLRAIDAASRPGQPAPAPLLFPNAENAL